jgi:hypothetical protein
MDFIEQLRRHIKFLKRSCAAFDAGHTEEALRIAVTLRVLFHDTKKSTSLLTHLGLKSSSLVLSSFEPGYIENKEDGTFRVTIPVMLDSLGERKAPLSRARRHDFITASEWWQEVIVFTNYEISRKDVILSAANQDGGAHVDATPDNKTAAMIRGTWTIKRVVEGKVIEQRVNNDHFPLLFQFGYEVLNSPEISQK